MGMDEITLENVNDEQKREMLFKESALKYLKKTKFELISEDYSGMLVKNNKFLKNIHTEEKEKSDNEENEKNIKKIKKIKKNIEEDDDHHRLDRNIQRKTKKVLSNIETLDKKGKKYKKKNK